MRTICLIAVVLACALPLGSRAEDKAALDWNPWRDLPVQNGGRQKPLDTLGWEMLRLIGNRSHFADPETDEELDGTALYLSMMFDWQGWDHSERDQLLLVMDWRPYYFRLHKADKWDTAPLMRVDFLELRTKLGMPQDDKYISPDALSKTLIEDTRTGRKIPFSTWGDQLIRQEAKGESLNKLEKKALELADRFWSYQNHRMGRALEIIPIQGSVTQEWMPIAYLVLNRFDNATDPSGHYRRAQQALQHARTAYLQRETGAFSASAAELKSAVRELGSEIADYPSSTSMSLEVAYNQWAPFRIAWALLFLAFMAMLFHLATGSNSIYVGALSIYVLGLLAVAIGFTARIIISGRPPVTNMYESVVYVAFGVAAFGLMFEMFYRAKYIITAAAAVSVVALILADNSPVILDPSVRPLEPVLRSNFWLVVHVMTITLSYAAFALALGLANITLGYYFARSSNAAAITSLSRFTYKAIQVGVLLLAAGTILGGVWADYSWGRFWGWDPKEVWALVALLGYLCVLHARFAGWVGHRGLAALSVGCFSLVVMAWYGVNFVLGAGLHSYGFGGGGQGWVYTAVILEMAYAGIALLRSRTPESANQRLSATLDGAGAQDVRLSSSPT